MSVDNIENGKLSGDLTITGDAVVGGETILKRSAVIRAELNVGGNVVAHRNLIVKGFIDAPNIKGASKGVYTSESSLIAAYPHPCVGWWAVVCENLAEQSYEGILYLVERNEYNRLVWENTEASINLGSLITTVQQFDEALEAINKQLTFIATDIESLSNGIESLAKDVKELQNTAITSVYVGGEGAVDVTDNTSAEKPLEKIFSIKVKSATHNEDGLMLAEDKTLLDNITKHIVYFDAIEEKEVVCHTGTCTDVGGIYYLTGNHAFLALGNGGYYYKEWVDSGEWAKYKSNADYMGSDGYPLEKIYMANGCCYLFDIKLKTLTNIGDFSKYVSIYDTVTEEENGIMTAEDKIHLNFLYDALNSGRVTNGTFRFLGVKKTTDDAFTINETDCPNSYDGVCWLSDKKMFCAYRAILVINNVAYAHFTYYTHWDTEKFFMEKPGEERGLWQDKIYIYRGAVYVWCNCEDDLIKINGSGFIRELTTDEIDEIMEDFELVEVGSPTGGVVDVTADGESPLNLEATPTETTAGMEVKITGNIDVVDMTEEEVEKLFE